MSKKTGLVTKWSEIEKKLENWKEGRNTQFKAGDVVKIKGKEQIGVIYYLLKDIEEYQVKWYVGPKPWNFIEGTIHGAYLEKTEDQISPLKYEWREMVPGPSSEMIHALQLKFAEKDRNKVRTAKDVEAYVESLEEELASKKKIIEIDETKVDSIIDETLEEDVTPIPVDDIDSKRKKIIDEE
jgi:DNA polymerase II large subunit